MRCIISKTNNPHFNLATEEYFLKNSDEEFFFIYINEPCIVVGKHQNLLSEINLRFALENKIQLARRISGGGTVYQDLNNLNFSFIHNCANLDQLNFTRFTYPVLEALKEMGLAAEFSGRNDLLIDTKKISGNAMHISRSRVLSHGTLLFNANLETLSAALRNNSQKYIDKSIKSVRSKVTNISNYFADSKSMDQFSQNLFQNIISKSTNPNFKSLDDQEKKSINRISTEKFETWEWIYGYSPNYVFQSSFRLSNRTVKLELKVEKGIIKNLSMNLDPNENPAFRHAFEALVNVKHDYQIICELFRKNEIINSVLNFNISEFCYSLF